MNLFLDNFDKVVQVFLLTAGALSAFFLIRNDIRSLKIDIDHIKENQKSLSEAFTQLGNILTKVAVQDTRIQMIEKKLDELSHGQGFVDMKRIKTT